MNILPKKCSEFKDKQYWNNFFLKLKNTDQQNFQWYGNYNDFNQQLKKIFKHLIHKNNQLIQAQNKQNLNLQQRLSIFHIGCGKSTFGQDIQLQYPTFKVINTDYSEQIIKDMIKRSLMMKTMCKYEVCDMFQHLAQKYIQKFNVVLDKGTLDAILPEDVEDEILKIKKIFFDNVEKAFNKKQMCSYIIISMLQPFVLRTILQHFYKKQQYEIQIQQSKIKDSKMQPFLVYIKRYPDSQPKIIQKITFKPLKGNKQLSFTQINDIMTRIFQIQQTVASQQKVKKLSPFQHLTYNISNPQNPQKMRYTIQIVDNQQNKFKQNNCAIFIVPQGKQNSFLFSNLKGLKRLITQVGTSRLIVIKLLSGNTFKSIDQVKMEINPLMASFIQQGCQIKQVPFMTDAEQLGVRKYVYQDENIYIEEILSGQEEAFRRVILKNNLSLVQSQYQLIYGKAQEYAHAKEIQKKTKILPAKKGKYTVINKQYLDEGYCQQIVTGLLKFVHINDKETPSFLVLGGGGYCIPKFLYQNLSSQLNIITVQKQKGLCSQQVLQIFQVLHHTKNQNFKIINDDAYAFVLKNQSKQQYSSIIVDINAKQQVQLPSPQFLSPQFIKKCYQLLNSKQGGVLIYNVIKKNFIKDQLKKIFEMNLFDLIYIAKQQQEQNKTQKQQEPQEQDCLVLFLVKLGIQKKNLCAGNQDKVAQVADQIFMSSSKQKGGKGNKKKQNYILELKQKHKFQFVNQISNSIKMISPLNRTNLKLK